MSEKTKKGTSTGAEKPLQLSGSQQLSGEVGRKYKLLVQILTSDPRYAKALADVIPASKHDELSSCLVNMSYEIGASLSIIKALIGLEFSRKKNHTSTIMRANSVIEKMTGKYSRLVGTEYLQKLIGKLVKDVYDKPDEDLSVDKDRMKGEDVDKRVEENIIKVSEICQTFIDRIMSKTMIDEMPRQLRAICYFLVGNGEIYKLDFEKVIIPLISGFIMLRFVCPAITLPDKNGIMPKAPVGNVRNTLTLIAKILQKMANGETFNTEAPSLMPFNSFIQKNQQNLFNYLRELPKDPEEVEGRLPFGDLQKTITFEDLHYKTFDMKDLLFIHQMIYEYGYELIVALQTEVIMTVEKRPVSIVSTETDFLALIQDLGPPPEKESKLGDIGDKPGAKPAAKAEDGRKPSIIQGLMGGKKTASKEPASPTTAEGGKKIKENLRDKNFNEIEGKILEKSMETLMKHIEQFDLSDLDQARFLYLGKPTKNNIPVVYLILSRVKTEFLMKNDKLMVYIFKTLQQVFKDKYVLVVDLSWTDMDDDLQAALYRATVSFTRLIKVEYLQSCQSIYLLHPTYKTQQAIDDILNIMAPETRQKMVKTAYDWMDLSEVIEPNKIWIPFVSKKFTPLTYHLIKINNVDKRKERYLKITHESILNIDSKACTIQNEILLGKIEEIRSRNGSNEIIIKYTAETAEEASQRGAVYFVKQSKKTGLQTKKYTCYTEQQREIVVEAIFEAGVRAASLGLPQTFSVEKQNKKGKGFKRVIKLTTDSLLIFKDKVIKTEIPYSTIQSFYLSEKDKTIMFINFMLRGKKKQYIVSHPKCEQMRDAMLDAIKRFKFGVQLEKDLFYKKDYDAALDRFFLAAKSKESYKEKGDEESKWTTVLRIDQPANDLNKLFKKFKPTGDKAEINPAKMKEVCSKLKLNLKEEEIELVIRSLDPEEKGLITLDDLVKAWVYMRRQKQMIEKRKQALQRKTETTKK